MAESVLDDLVEALADAARTAESLRRQSVAAYWRAGDAAASLKRRLPHGRFQDVLSDLGINPRTARRWMALRKKYDSEDAAAAAGETLTEALDPARREQARAEAKERRYVTAEVHERLEAALEENARLRKQIADLAQPDSAETWRAEALRQQAWNRELQRKLDQREEPARFQAAAERLSRELGSVLSAVTGCSRCERRMNGALDVLAAAKTVLARVPDTDASRESKRPYVAVLPYVGDAGPPAVDEIAAAAADRLGGSWKRGYHRPGSVTTL